MAVVFNIVGSEPAPGEGSVIEKHDLILAAAAPNFSLFTPFTFTLFLQISKTLSDFTSLVLPLGDFRHLILLINYLHFFQYHQYELVYNLIFVLIFDY